MRFFCHFTRFFLAAQVLLIAGCVLPPDPSTQPSWVAPAELKVVSLVKDGLGYTTSGRLVDAELNFLQALKISPNSPNIYLNLVVVLERQGRIDEALAMVDGLQKKYPNSIRFKTARARLLALSGKFEEAETEYIEALHASDEDPRQKQELAGILRSLSSLKFKTGFEEDAICYALEEIGVAPTKEAYIRVAKLYNAADYPKLAIKILEAGLAQNLPRGDPEVLKQMAIAYVAQGEMDVADRFISRTVRSGAGPQGVGFELLLLRELVPVVAKKKSESETTNSDGTKIEEEVKEEVEPEESTELHPLEDSRVTNLEQRAVLTLYWPSRLLALLEQRLAEKAAEDALKSAEN